VELQNKQMIGHGWFTCTIAQIVKWYARVRYLVTDGSYRPQVAMNGKLMEQ